MSNDNVAPHITLTVFKNKKPKDNFSLILSTLKQSLLDLAKVKLREACAGGDPVTKDMFSKLLKTYDLGLTLQHNATLVAADISYNEFDSYRDKLKVELKEWIEKGYAISELFVMLLLENEVEGES